MTFQKHGPLAQHNSHKWASDLVTKCVCVCVCVCVCGMCSVKSPPLCGPMDCSPPGSSVHGIFQANILEWLPFLTPEYLPNPGIKPASLVSCTGSQVLYH